MPGGLEATPDHAPGKICRGLGARGQLVATPGREFLCSAPGAAPQTLRTQSRMKLVNIAHLMKNAETFPPAVAHRGGATMFPSVSPLLGNMRGQELGSKFFCFSILHSLRAPLLGARANRSSFQYRPQARHSLGTRP